MVYFNKPGTVDNFLDMITEGEVHGRLRSNNFYYAFKNPDIGHKDNVIGGVGASIVYESATYSNIDFLLGYYVSTAFFDHDKTNTRYFKSGKDLFSRHDYSNNGDRYMAVLGQASVKYSGIAKSDIILGRQFVETFYTKSNDTKMIPNTFDGGVFKTKLLSDTKLQFAYLAKQKLRDHTENHSVLMVDDRSSSDFSKWDGNDDSAMHRGLTHSALKANNKKTDAPLLIVDAKNKSVKNLKIDSSFYNVPELLSQAMLELNYKLKFDGFSISPGIRYIRQFDNGAGKVGGASYLNNTKDYSDPTSLEAEMIAARVVTKIGDYKINLGFSNIRDKADLVTPWRGFPTAGYTRSMGVYNWRANTKSYRLELVRNPNDNAVYRDVFVQASVLYTDADDDKFAGDDYMYYYIGFIQNIPALPELQWRLRVGYNQFLDQPAQDYSYLDSRFELNYMF